MRGDNEKIRDSVGYMPVAKMADLPNKTEESGSSPDKSSQHGFTKKNVIGLSILCFVNLINYMDRYTVSAILDKISEVLCETEKCSTEQMGLLGTAFLIVYFMVAPIFGYLGDRYSRKHIMAAGILLWGAMSLTASFMSDYWSFLVFRACIAIGESAFTTIAPTVLADLFMEETRTMVFGIFYLAIPVGSGLGYVVGEGPSDWRWGLRITPGMNVLAVILILLFLDEPPRGSPDHQKVNESSWGKDLRYIVGIKSFLLNVAGFTCVTFTTGALSWYGPLYVKYGIQSCVNGTDENGDTIYKDNCDTSIDQDNVAFLFGVVLMISGILGVLSGMLLSKFLRPRFPRIDPLICGGSLLLSCPLIIYAVFTAKENVTRMFIMMCLGTTFLNMNWSISTDMSLYVIVPERRSTAEAIHLMASHALGEAGAPYILGLISDHLIAKDCDAGKYDCDIDAQESEARYYGLQSSLWLAFGLLCCGGVLFLLAAIWIAKEKAVVDRIMERSRNNVMDEFEEAEDEKMNFKMKEKEG